MKKFQLLPVLAIAFSATLSVAEPAPVSSLYKSDNANSLIRLERLLEARNKMQLDMQNQLEQMSLEFNELRGIVEKNSFQINQVIERQKNIYRDIDQLRNQATNTTKPAAVSEEETSYSSNANENIDYDNAVNLILKSKDYIGAAAAFNTFLDKYPSSPYKPNAHYWLGQLYFSKNKLTDAKKHFKAVSEFEKSTKKPDALLKLGIIEGKLNNNAESEIFLKQVIHQFPESTSAKQAQKILGL